MASFDDYFTFDFSGEDTSSADEGHIDNESVLTFSPGDPGYERQNTFSTDYSMKEPSFKLEPGLTDEELFFPTEYYRDWVRVKKEPAIVSREVEDSYDHNIANDKINKRYFPDWYTEQKSKPILTHTHSYQTPDIDADSTSNNDSLSEDLTLQSSTDQDSDTISGSGFTGSMDDEDPIEDTPKKSKLYSINIVNGNDKDNPNIELILPIGQTQDETRSAILNKEATKTYLSIKRKIELELKKIDVGELTESEENELNKIDDYFKKHDTVNDRSISRIVNHAGKRVNLYKDALTILKLDKAAANKRGETYQGDLELREDYMKRIRIYCGDSFKANEFMHHVQLLNPLVTSRVGSKMTIDEDKLFDIALIQEIEFDYNLDLPNVKGETGFDKIVSKVLPEEDNDRSELGNDAHLTYSNLTQKKRKLESEIAKSIVTGIVDDLADEAIKYDYPNYTGTFKIFKRNWYNMENNPEYKKRWEDFMKSVGIPSQKQLNDFIRAELNRIRPPLGADLRSSSNQPIYDTAVETYGSMIVAKNRERLESLKPNKALGLMKSYFDPKNSLINSETEPTYAEYTNGEKSPILLTLGDYLEINSTTQRSDIDESLNKYYHFYHISSQANIHRAENTRIIMRTNPEAYALLTSYYNSGDKDKYAKGMAFLSTLRNVKSRLEFDIKNADVKYSAKSKNEFNKGVISGDKEAIKIFEFIYDPTKSESENSEMLIQNARNRKLSLESEERSAEDTQKYLKTDSLLQYIEPSIYISLNEFARILGDDDALDKINEINKGAEDAISRMDSESAKFVARFLKNNTSDIIIIAAAFASGSTAAGAALNYLKKVRGYAMAYQSIKDTYDHTQGQGLSTSEIGSRMIIALIMARVSTHIEPKAKKLLVNNIKKYLSEKMSKGVVDFGSITVKEGWHQASGNNDAHQ